MDYAIITLNQLRPILQGFRKTAGLTQAAMAARLGVTQQTYAQLEANPAAVSVERLFKVLRILRVDLKLSQTGAADHQPAAPTRTPAAKRAPEASGGSGAGPATRAARKQPGPAKTPAQARGTAAAERSPGPATAARDTGGARAVATNRPARAAAGSGKKREEW
ncbi:helix-turn-helix domain-containing protein [Paraburkholderia sp. MMS20-SJTR3]|uniref:Helix-turn-helix domain-containing protein n=1 Tax=Paraburkholderia sejongensis TaxID=2886946 RepID=A0ABS8K0E4_9BURK|nr:helix-turn-helix transcriptional regulator [Paraburkholderia sp. MMS20-SJTR3]MCC8395644.1 helix-turn-helix domain-containing protein [Paraburkholderia sp. MMS20-SJTR3]